MTPRRGLSPHARRALCLLARECVPKIVTQELQELIERGCVTYDPLRGWNLTERGKREFRRLAS